MSDEIKITRESVDARLKIDGHGIRDTKVLFEGQQIGLIVSYGRARRNQSRTSFAATVYGSRIYWKGLTITEEASKLYSLRPKIVAKLAQGLKAKGYTLSPLPEEEPEIGFKP